MSDLQFIRHDLLLDSPAISHGFTTRLGGVSQGHFSALNLSPYSGEDESVVAENRRRVCEVLGVQSLVTLKQVHSSIVHRIGDRDDLGVEREGDGLVTTLPGVALGVLGADCAPILFADPCNGVVGAAHGGWKGAATGITDEVIKAMELEGADRATMLCVIGPAIQQASYEVGEDLRQAVKEISTIESDSYFSQGNAGKWQFDLPGYLVARVNDAGVGQIAALGKDTYTDPDNFYSYRRTCHRGESTYGRQMGAIALLPSQN